MKKKELEESATSGALVLLVMIMLITVLAFADRIFGWDLLTPGLESLAMFLIAACGVMLAGCVLVSLMLNLSIIASKLSELAERDKERTRNE